MNSRGNSLIGIVIAAGIGGVVMSGIMSMMNVVTKQQLQSNLTFQAAQVRNNLTEVLNSQAGWTATVAANAALDCIRTGTPCTTTGAAGAPPLTGIAIPIVVVASGQVIYDATPATAGFSAQGTVCSSFVAPPGVGNDGCPLRYVVIWNAICATPACVSPQVQILIQPVYNPSSSKERLAFNPSNYGANFYQGSAVACGWTFSAGALTETCATNVGIGTSQPGVGTADASTGRVVEIKGAGATGTELIMAGSDNSKKLALKLIPAGALNDGNKAWIVGRTPGEDDFSFVVSNGSSEFSRMTIDSSGRVGIGTTTPQALLHINGGGLMPVTIGNAKLYSGTTSAGVVQALVGISTGDNTLFRTANGYQWQDSALQTVMRILPNGRIGMGTLNPSVALHVSNADARIYLQDTAGSGNAAQAYIAFHDAGGAQKGWVGDASATNDNVSLHSTSGNVVAGNATGSCTYSGGAGWSCSSDGTLKKNVQTLEGALEGILSLRGVTYEWIESREPGRKRLGLIAQEVERVFPQAVEIDGERGKKAVDYSALTAPLIESIKDLHRQLGELRAQSAELKHEIEKIKAQR